MKRLVTSSYCLHVAAGSYWCRLIISITVQGPHFSLRLTHSITDKLPLRFHHDLLWAGDVQSISTSIENGLLQKIPWFNGMYVIGGETGSPMKSNGQWVLISLCNTLEKQFMDTNLEQGCKRLYRQVQGKKARRWQLWVDLKNHLFAGWPSCPQRTWLDTSLNPNPDPLSVFLGLPPKLIH